MHKFVIVHFIKGDPRNKEFNSSDWPLHITLLGNFNTEINEGESKLIETLSNYAKEIKPFDLRVGEEALFGPNKDILVNTMELNKEIMDLHENLKRLIDSVGAIYDSPQYIGKNYRPHATVQNTDRVYQNEIVRINSLSLVDMEPDGVKSKRRLIKTFNF
jgi:2'-5' RNA ligase